MEKMGDVSFRLEENVAASEASTLPSTPQQPSPVASASATAIAAPAPAPAPAPATLGREGGAAGAVGIRNSRARAPKRARRDAVANAEWRWGLGLGTAAAAAAAATAYSTGVRSTITETGVIMKFSTMAAASGGLCLVVAVFSGPALIALAVLTLGVCGICYGIRKQGAIKYLPSGVVELLTRTTLLEFLTDTSVFDAVKTYLVFMMGLSEDETQGVLRSLPEDMRHTLTRPGMMHTLPGPLQDLLLSSNPAPATARLLTAEYGQEVSGSRRRRRPAGREGSDHGGAGDAGPRAIERARGRYEADEEREAPPLGQLVWTPLPAGPAAPERVAARGEADEQAFVEEDDPAAPSESSVFSDEEDSEILDSEEEEEVEEAGQGERGRGRARSTNRAGGGVVGEANGVARRRLWAESPPRAGARSLSPGATPYRTRSRAATDGVELDGERVQLSALPERTSRQGVAGWFGGVIGARASGAANSTAAPSAERLVASILQRRVDSAMRAAWDAVDERGVRRAAVGSGIALAAHMAFSERARRQAGSMLRGGLLAALAGTATVCAGLAYLKPGEAARGQTSSNATRDSDPDEQVGTEEETGADAASADEAASREGTEDTLSRVRRCRAGVERWLAVVTPNTRNMVRLLGLICLLLAVRKWQLLRRAALRAMRPRSLYGFTPP